MFVPANYICKKFYSTGPSSQLNCTSSLYKDVIQWRHDSQHNDTRQRMSSGRVSLRRCYAKCHYAECRGANVDEGPAAWRTDNDQIEI